MILFPPMFTYGQLILKGSLHCCVSECAFDQRTKEEAVPSVIVVMEFYEGQKWAN